MPARKVGVKERLRRYGKRLANGCIVWTAGRTKRGYGQIKVNGRTCSVHRVAWELRHGPLPSHLFACHHCDNPSCFNVEHLFVGTAADNMADMARKGRAAKGLRNGRYTKPESVLRGEDNGNAKLTEAQVLEMRRRYREGGISTLKLAAEYRIGKSMAFLVVRGHSWKHVKE